jgi:predicted nucleotidyltransferase
MVINGQDIIFKCLVGSHAYGTNVEGSDRDYKGIFIQSPEDVLINGYKEQIEVNKDEVYYELKRFIDLCCTANPTMLELLFMPEDCIVYKHPVMDILLIEGSKMLSKQCKYSFGGYAKAQIKKASGLNKKMNWEKDEMIRKNPLDFCWVPIVGKHDILIDIHTHPDGEELVTYITKGIYPLDLWLDKKGYTENDVVLNKLNHTKEGYQLFEQENSKGLGVDNSNNLRVSETPKESLPIATVLYNADAYSAHCRKYREYTEWLKNRNTQRYVDIKTHNQQIDGKNMLHCLRLIQMGLEIAQGEGINVRRPNAKELVAIRKGEVDLSTLLKTSEHIMNKMDELFDKSALPDKADKDYFKKIMIKMREMYAKK